MSVEDYITLRDVREHFTDQGMKNGELLGIEQATDEARFARTNNDQPIFEPWEFAPELVRANLYVAGEHIANALETPDWDEEIISKRDYVQRWIDNLTQFLQSL